MSQHIFGYTKAEAIGLTPPDLTYGPTYLEIASHLIRRAAKGESWSGEFPARNKKREMFNVVTTLVPYCDENGTIIGVLGICTDARQFRELRPSLDGSTRSSSDTFENDPLPSLQTTITSKLSNLAHGMNYLHHHQPPIIHRDLKSSNLLVDKNWTVKVGDFGLSRIKRETYLNTKTGKGTPQWMAPEVLRNKQADEKSDVYSYGVVLWEIVTKKIPWDNLDPVQVIGAVGFMNQRLEIPNDVNPQWASLIGSCWSRLQCIKNPNGSEPIDMRNREIRAAKYSPRNSSDEIPKA
ncbi:PAS domain-containing protein tyrosine kinase family protein [Tanacetum coccineum]|uniref:PAS domain-containing protein tyrosine kinase family protein n=1 Tax=Tanacetum coccineum TaxID=301880 RepID=A0ABQ5BZU5_9ASTR